MTAMADQPRTDSKADDPIGELCWELERGGI